MTSKYSNKSLQILLSLFLISAFTACNSDSKKNENLQYFQEHGEIFTTGYSIKYEYSRSLSEEIKSELDRFDLSLNPFKDNSIITKVNNNEEVELDSFYKGFL